MSEAKLTYTKNSVSTGCALKYDAVYEALKESYSVYYNLDTTGEEPFIAVGHFDSNSEQYFLIKAARISEMRSAEYVYFAREKELNYPSIYQLDETAWERGLSLVDPGPTHKNTDICLIVIADKINEAAKEFVTSVKHSKNYRLALYGFSNYRLVAIELSSGTAYFNRQGRILRELVGKVLLKPYTNEREIMK